MKILTVIEEKEETVTRGRGTGSTTKFNIAIGYDNYQWMLTKQVQKSDGTFYPPTGGFFYAKFKQMLPAMDKRDDLPDPRVVAKKMIDKLVKTKPISDEKKKEILDLIEKDLEKAGEALDKTFELNYHKHDDIYKRKF